MKSSTTRVAWIVGTALGAAAVVGGAILLTSKPANASPSPPAPSPAPPGPPAPSGGGGTPTTPITDPTLVQTAQNTLAQVSAASQVPGLAYTMAQATADKGNPAAAAFVQQLAVFQAYVNAVGGFLPQGATQALSLNTTGTLDYATAGALLAVATGQALNPGGAVNGQYHMGMPAPSPRATLTHPYARAHRG